MGASRHPDGGGVPFAIFVQCKPRRTQPTWKPAGAETASAAAWQRWIDDGYAYPPYQYEPKNLVMKVEEPRVAFLLQWCLEGVALGSALSTAYLPSRGLTRRRSFPPSGPVMRRRSHGEDGGELQAMRLLQRRPCACYSDMQCTGAATCGSRRRACKARHLGPGKVWRLDNFAEGAVGSRGSVLRTDKEPRCNIEGAC